MNNQAAVCFLIVLAAGLVFLVLYQQYAFRRGIQSQLKQVNKKLEEIARTGSDEKVMVFTGNPVMMELCRQINSLLNERQKIKADVKKGEISSRKMLANISHDIKTPLTVILGYLEIMRLGGSDNAMLKKAEEKAGQTVDMINQFFTLAKLESGDMDIEFCRLDICELCRRNVLEFYEILVQKGFEAELSIPEAAVFVWADESALQRILHNLLSNAVRYGADGGYLGVFLRQDDSRVYIDVADRGKGISPESAAHVFDRLYTAEDSRNREIQGNGLGLTIAKNLARQMEGDISLQSVPGVKTVFTLELKKMNF